MLKHLILINLLFQIIFSLNCNSLSEDKKNQCLIANKIQNFYYSLNKKCLINKICFNTKLTNFALNLNPEILLKDDYKKTIKEESEKIQRYKDIIEKKQFKEFFDLTKKFIINIQRKVVGARGTTHDDEYFTTICKFFMRILSLEQKDCD